MRRSAFDRTPGFASLRLEQADDAALGQMLKQSGRVVRWRAVAGRRSGLELG